MEAMKRAYHAHVATAYPPVICYAYGNAPVPYGIQGNVSSYYNVHGHFSDARNPMLPASSEIHVTTHTDRVHVGKGHNAVENQSTSEKDDATEIRDTAEDTAIDPPQESPTAPAWFFPPKVRTSKDIWAPDCVGDRRVTDWPSLKELSSAGDKRAVRGEDRMLPIPRYHNVDARFVHLFGQGEDSPTAFAAPTVRVPYSYRKYAVNLTGPVNRYPIPCDRNEEEAKGKKLQSAVHLG
ncbi:hypothetical protein PG994_002246 [Apiospora phragmitis]|uniref:Uncharacterized protein n=1 Tax=Apiospora phragmitis TaxID=2905665 RepID=A0ABR1WVZ7_9PEZI